MLNDALVKQMSDSITMLELPSQAILVRSYLNVPTNLPEVVFMDEAYDIMLKSSIKFNIKGETAGLLGIPNKAAKTIFLSGVKCNQMPSLLQALYSESAYVCHQFGSTS